MNQIISIAINYWWAFTMFVVVVVATIIFFRIRRSAAQRIVDSAVKDVRSRQKAKEIMVNAVIYGNRRVVKKVPASEIENFQYLLPRQFKGKKIYFLEPIGGGSDARN